MLLSLATVLPPLMPRKLFLLASQGRVCLRSALAGTLLTSLIISKSTLGRSLTLLIQERSRDLYDDTDTNLLYILLVSKLYCKCVVNNMNFNSTLTKLLGSKFFQSQKMRALSWEQTIQLRIISENQDRSQTVFTRPCLLLLLGAIFCRAMLCKCGLCRRVLSVSPSRS